MGAVLTTPSPTPPIPVRLPRPLSRRRLPLFALLVGIGVGQAVGAVGLALLVQRVFDELVTGTTPVTQGRVLALGAGLVAVVALAAAMRWAERVAAERLGQDYVVEVRAQLFDHLIRVPARALSSRNRGSLLLGFVGDLSALRSWVSLGLARLLVAGVAVALAVVSLAFIDWRIALALAVTLASGGLLVLAASPRLLATARTARRRRARLTGEVTERLSHVGVLQASGQERRERKRVGKHSEKVSEAMVDRARAAGVLRAIAEGTGGLATVAVVLVGAYQVRSGATTPGAVVGAVAIVGLLTGHLRDLGRVAEYAAGARVGREAVRRFLLLPTLPEPADAPALVPGQGRLELHDVCLGAALHDVTLSAEPGQTVAVVGPNGAGKSTLVALAGRLVDADAGRVLLDGQDLADYSIRSVRGAIGVAGPDLPLLRGSVDRNVRYRLPRASDEQVARVAALCGLDALVEALPDGWRSDVGDGGSLLSAGQRARVTVARAVLGEPAVLLLDEAEAHLDETAAGLVDRVLAAHAGTAIVVTHRRALVERADVVWCLVDGRVCEVGPPAQLLVGDGPTARLFGHATAALEVHA